MESSRLLITDYLEHKVIIVHFCSCMDLLDFIKVLVHISLTWPAKLTRVTWRRLQLQILIWELEGLDPQYVVPTELYPIQYWNFIQEEHKVSSLCYYQEYGENYFFVIIFSSSEMCTITSMVVGPIVNCANCANDLFQLFVM